MISFKPHIALYDESPGTIMDDLAGAKDAFSRHSGNAARVAMFCRMNDVEMWMVSDASVFPGYGSSAAHDDPYPVHTFGLSRLLGERAVRSILPAAVIVRVGWLYGPELPNGPPMIAEDTFNGTRSTANVQSGILGSPTFLGDAAEVLATNLPGEVNGGEVFHLAPNRKTDWYEYLCDDYPEVSPTKIAYRRDSGGRDGSLIPSAGWVVPPGGLARFQAEVRK